MPVDKEAKKRGKALEDKTRKYLDERGCKYISAKNQTVKCYKCGRFQQVRTQGYDFHVYAPPSMAGFVECKAGDSRLSPSQLALQSSAMATGVPYTVVTDKVDDISLFFS